jgi:hypothetical protein
MTALYLASSPRPLLPLQLDYEMRGITEAVRKGPLGDALNLVSAWAARPRDLQAELLRHKPQILHFGGHGEGPLGIVLEDDSGNGKAVSPEALGDLLRRISPRIRLVVLNACNSIAGVEYLTTVVDHVIAMAGPIGDSAAQLFSQSFYEAFAFGESVTKAFELGVNRLRLEGSDDATMPVLRSRRAARPFRLPRGLPLRENPTARPDAKEKGRATTVIAGRARVDTVINASASTMNLNVPPRRKR